MHSFLFLLFTFPYIKSLPFLVKTYLPVSIAFLYFSEFRITDNGCPIRLGVPSFFNMPSKGVLISRVNFPVSSFANSIVSFPSPPVITTVLSPEPSINILSSPFPGVIVSFPSPVIIISDLFPPVTMSLYFVPLIKLL